MKQKLFIFTVFILNLNCIASSYAGGVGDGGGNILHSTPGQVMDYLNKVQQKDILNPQVGLAVDLYNFVSTSKRILEGRSVKPRSSKVQSLLEKMKPQIDSLNFYFQQKSPLDPKNLFNVGDWGINLVNDKLFCDTLEHKKGLDACYDKKTDRIYLIFPRIVNYPPSLLSAAIFPLVIHEMAHKAGFDEETAQWLQAYFSEEHNATRCTFEMDFYPEGENLAPKKPELYGGRIKIEFLDYIGSLVFQTQDFTANVNGIASGGHVSNHWVCDVQADTKSFPPIKSPYGNISSYYISWGSNNSGILEFDALDQQKGELKSVRDIIVWGAPKASEGVDKDLYGGMKANAIKGTKIIFKGREFTPDNSVIFIKFYGNCFNKH